MNRNLMIKLFLPLLLVLLVICCHGSPGHRLLLFDFETEKELSRLNWKCHVIYELDSEHKTHGSRSLRLEMYPSGAYPGMSTGAFEHDWSGYKKLCVDIFNPEDAKIGMTLRIDDKEDYPDYADRVNKRIVVSEGWNHFCFDLDTLFTSGTGRRLDLSNVTRFCLFTAHPDQVVTLFLDNIHLRQ